LPRNYSIRTGKSERGGEEISAVLRRRDVLRFPHIEESNRPSIVSGT
jgi:hypothetical protein